MNQRGAQEAGNKSRVPTARCCDNNRLEDCSRSRTDRGAGTNWTCDPAQTFSQRASSTECARIIQPTTRIQCSRLCGSAIACIVALIETVLDRMKSYRLISARIAIWLRIKLLLAATGLDERVDRADSTAPDAPVRANAGRQRESGQRSAEHVKRLLSDVAHSRVVSCLASLICVLSFTKPGGQAGWLNKCQTAPSSQGSIRGRTDTVWHATTQMCEQLRRCNRRRRCRSQRR